MRQESKYTDLQNSKIDSINNMSNRDTISFHNDNFKTNKSDHYNTSNLTILQRVEFYDNKLEEIKNLKNNHKVEIQTIRSVKNSTQNVLQFRLDEVTKKMKNEIFRLSEESRRHEESQTNENQKIQNQINYISENCDGLDKLLSGNILIFNNLFF